MSQKNQNILDANGVAKTLEDIVNAIAGSDSFEDGQLGVIGIHRRGDVLAKRIRSGLEMKVGKTIHYGALDINLYRDDLSAIGPAPVIRSSSIEFDINDKKIILVDDVLYTGRTIRAALMALCDFGRPRYIKLAVLIDRGGRELPIAAQFVGKTLDVPDDAIVHVSVDEYDKEENVYVTGKEKQGD